MTERISACGLGAVGRLLIDQLDLGLLMSRRHRIRFDQPRALRAFDQHANGAVGQLQQLHRRGDDAEVVERIAIGIVLGRIELGDQEQFLVGGHRRLERGDRFLAPDEQGHDAVRENDDVAKRQDGKRSVSHGRYMGGRAVASAIERI